MLGATFVRRPVAATLLAVAIMAIGLVALARLPIASVPAVERPVITVSGMLPGASPDTIASSLAQPLERELGLIPGIVEMTSYNAVGATQIQIQFELDKDIDLAAGEVQAALNAAAPNLPKNLPAPPSYSKANSSGYAPVAIALTSDVIPSGTLFDFADAIIAPKLSEVEGVAQTTIAGGQKSAVRIRAHPQVMANMRLSLEQLREAIRRATVNAPKGSLAFGGKVYALCANDQLIKAEDYRGIDLLYRNGAPIKLGDVATVEDSVINDEIAGWYNRQRAVLVFVLKQPDANVVAVVDAVKRLIPELSRQLPAGLRIHLLYDRTALIRASVLHMKLTIAISIFLVAVAIAIFLRRLAATVIPILTIPVVLGATLAVIWLCGYSLNNLTLMALTIAIGFIVDDSVIIIENIIRHIDEGAPVRVAAVDGVREVGFTIVSITASLTGALMPILLMPDVIGRYFREFGVALVAAIVASALVSLAFSPMLCSRLLAAPGSGGKPGSPPARSGAASAAYLRSLDWTFRHPASLVSLLLLLSIGSGWIYYRLPKGFMPTQDIGLLTVQTVSIANISFAAMEATQQQVADTVLKDRAVEGLSSFIGTGNGQSLATGTLYVNLKPIDVRHEPIEAVIDRLRAKLAAVRGTRAFLTPWQDLVLGIQHTAARYQYTMTGSDPDQLWQASEKMRRLMLRMPELADVVTSAERAGLEANLQINRERAATLSVTPQGIDNTLYDAFGQRWVKIIYLPLTTTEVVMEIDPTLQTSPAFLGQMFVPGGRTSQIPLAAVTDPRRKHADMWIRHEGTFPSITLSFDLKQKAAIGDVIKKIHAAEEELHLPVKTTFRGEAAEASQSQTREVLLALGAIFAIYVVLGMLYESFGHPLIILTTLPSGLFGALMSLAVAGVEFTLISAIGCILVVGIVMKNAIIMVDFALVAERSQGLSPREAIRLAADLRLRPILMTSFVTILGALPLVLMGGAGYEIRQPFGVATLGGLVGAQVVTLYSTPVIYLLVDRIMRATRMTARPAREPSVHRP